MIADASLLLVYGGHMSEKREPKKHARLNVLKPGDIRNIERALKKIGAFGQVELILEGGRLRFVRTIKSEAVIPPEQQGDSSESEVYYAD